MVDVDLLGVPLILWATHSLVAVVTGSVVYLTMKAQADRGGPMKKPTSGAAKSAVAIILLSLTLIVFGLQTRAAEHDAGQRRSQQACLNRFTADVSKYLVDTLNTRVAANAKLERAQAEVTAAGLAQAHASTEVFLAVAGLTVDHPPTKTRSDFVRALERFREATVRFDTATRKYADVAKSTKSTLSQTGTPSKPYDPPKVACVR